MLFSISALRYRHFKGSVATHLWCGGIFSDSITTHIIPILRVKKFEISQYLIKLQGTQNKVCQIFWTTQ